MKILVSGASGFFGSNFINLASTKGHYIYAISRYKQKRIKNVKWIIGKFEKNHECFKKCEVLIHFASAGVANRNLSYKKAFEINVIKSAKFLINAARAGCLKWVIIGTSSEYGKTLQSGKPVNVNSQRLPVCNYGKTKLIFTELTKILSKIFKARCRIMRSFPVYGVNESKNRLIPKLLKAIKEKKNFIIKNPMEIRDFSDVKDIVKKILRATNFPKKNSRYCEEWHLASGKAVSVGDFVKYICKKKQFNQKLIFKKKINNLFHHISNKKSIW
jgi:nucleoside-diphosphate-sugar epimerase